MFLDYNLSKKNRQKYVGLVTNNWHTPPCLTICPAHGKINAARASPSGKALAFQANIRGFESRRPLSIVFRYQTRDSGLHKNVN